jgi:hypothetical protein
MGRDGPLHPEGTHAALEAIPKPIFFMPWLPALCRFWDELWPHHPQKNKRQPFGELPSLSWRKSETRYCMDVWPTYLLIEM